MPDMNTGVLMPLYDFHCEQCETRFEVRASIKEKQAGLQPDVRRVTATA